MLFRLNANISELHLTYYLRGYVVAFTTDPPARNPCKALSEVAAEFNRFTITFLTNDHVCPAKRRTRVRLLTTPSFLAAVMYIYYEFYIKTLLKLLSRMNTWQTKQTNRANCDSYLYYLEGLSCSIVLSSYNVISI